MAYTKLAAIVAGLAFFLGVIVLFMGLGVATGYIIEPEPGRYLGSKTSGEAITQGIYYMVFGIVLGTLSEISTNLSNILNTKGKQ